MTRYRALATDYDGTLASDGVVAPHALEALHRLKAAGYRLLLVTGRLLEELEEIFPGARTFDRVVAENGAVLYTPAKGEIRLLAGPPPPSFAEALAAAGCNPLQSGHVIVSTREPWEPVVLETVREMGLEMQIIFNKGAVMCLPTGVTKGTGVVYALDELRIGPDETVAVGDAENDHSLLREAGLAAAVANALPMLKETADFVTPGRAGNGVVDLVDLLLEGELAPYEALAAERLAAGRVAVSAERVDSRPRDE